MLRLPLLAVAMALVGCAEDPFFIEGKASEVCQHLPAQRFGVPREVREAYARLPVAMQQRVLLERTFDFDVSAELPPETEEMLKAQVSLTAVRLAVVDPSDDLGFIDEAHFQLHPGAGSALEAQTFDYVRSEEAPRTVTWAGQAFDVAAYLASGSLRYTMSLVGSLPPGDVVVDIDACAAVSVKLDYL